MRKISLVLFDKSWIIEYNPDTKRQSEEWHCKFLSTKESSNEQIVDQIKADLFLFLANEESYT